nr:hypothetical protein BN993_00553 [Virgibacillus halodenitrificans]
MLIHRKACIPGFFVLVVKIFILYCEVTKNIEAALITAMGKYSATIYYYIYEEKLRSETPRNVQCTN